MHRMHRTTSCAMCRTTGAMHRTTPARCVTSAAAARIACPSSVCAVCSLSISHTRPYSISGLPTHTVCVRLAVRGREPSIAFLMEAERQRNETERVPASLLLTARLQPNRGCRSLANGCSVKKEPLSFTLQFQQLGCHQLLLAISSCPQLIVSHTATHTRGPCHDTRQKHLTSYALSLTPLSSLLIPLHPRLSLLNHHPAQSAMWWTSPHAWLGW
jgi:hypothetical protein